MIPFLGAIAVWLLDHNSRPLVGPQQQLLTDRIESVAQDADLEQI